MTDDKRTLPGILLGGSKPEDGGTTIDLSQMPEILPILPLRGVVLYPLTVRALAIGQPRSIRLIDEVSIKDRLVGLVASKDPSKDEPHGDDLYKFGTIGHIHRLTRGPNDAIHAVVIGLERIRIEEYTAEEPYLQARVTLSPEQVPGEEDVEAQALMRSILSAFGRYVSLAAQIPNEVAMSAADMADMRQLLYTAANSIEIELQQAQWLLESSNFTAKMRKVLSLISHEAEVLEVGRKIQSETKSQVDKSQREYILREQLKAIQRELGEGEDQERAQEFKDKIEKVGMPVEAKREADRELGRLQRVSPASPEYGVIETYLDWLTDLPWSVTTEDQLDIERAQFVLDEDHYDLDRIKERILEYLAVRKLKAERGISSVGTTQLIRPEREGVILCFVGPPGVGKTSLGQSIARALGRKFIRMSLGGVRDEAEMRGHRRTYIGAMPGRIIQAIRRIGTKNPVMMLDEVDKLGSDWRGDPSSALLEILDPEQNREFRDHYLGVPFDLSGVMFITTANVSDTIPGPLLDRMEVLNLSGYTDQEKLHIAKRYLIPRQLKENGLRDSEVIFDDDAILRLVHEYTREAGVRNLEREVGSICRKIATRIAAGAASAIVVRANDIEEYLKKPLYFREAKERTEVPGVATGLAMTPVGGDILFVEATRMPGAKQLIITGQLGDVMKESAQAALSFIRSQARSLRFDPDFFEKSDVHVHVPAGAVPKDGPSAGITIATALASMLSGRLVKGDVGMTGEITLRGKVLPVGGIKEKVLAAHRAGLKSVIIPRLNERDLDELPQNVKDEMNFVLVDNVRQVLDEALEIKSVYDWPRAAGA